jgi:DNA polymerase-3 subunit alpha
MDKEILAGYTLGQADLLRRAMGKKNKEILDKEFVPFQQGCTERGYSDKAIQPVWDVLVPFAPSLPISSDHTISLPISSD